MLNVIVSTVDMEITEIYEYWNAFMLKYQDKASIRLIFLDMKIFSNIFSCLLDERLNKIKQEQLIFEIIDKSAINFLSQALLLKIRIDLFVLYWRRKSESVDECAIPISHKRWEPRLLRQRKSLISFCAPGFYIGIEC